MDHDVNATVASSSPDSGVEHLHADREEDPPEASSAHAAASTSSLNQLQPITGSLMDQVTELSDLQDIKLSPDLKEFMGKTAVDWWSVVWWDTHHALFLQSLHQ